jgi:ribonuclease HII
MSEKPAALDLERSTIEEVKRAIEERFPPPETEIQALERDARAGIRDLATHIRKRLRAETRERARLENMATLENKLRDRGIFSIAGVDEAGRGPLAGPVVAAAVILPAGTLIPGLNDSKKLSETRREALYKQIQEIALACAVGESSPLEIDEMNIRNATHLAMRRALAGLSCRPDKVIVDGNALPGSPNSELAIVGGDRKSISIAAASIIAKVTRDRIMVQEDRNYPEYGFSGHKGYGSAEHLKALIKYGASPIHRRSFAGVPGWDHPLSEDFQVFADGITAARDMDELAAMGHSVASAAENLPDQEIQMLREIYSRRREVLLRPGNLGEAMASTFLKQNGYTILETNYRALGGEIDIIAESGDALCFIEVKTANQSHFGDVRTWVPPRKQRQIIRIARAYLKEVPAMSHSPRFDVIAIDMTAGKPKIEHIPSAFVESR